MASFLDRLKHGWNAFSNEEKKRTSEPIAYGSSYSSSPYRTRSYFGNDKNLVQSIINRLAVDAASIEIRHIRTDDTGRYKEDMTSELNERLSFSANLDQTAQAFKLDLYQTLLEEGVCAIVPVDTNHNPDMTRGLEILSMRVGKITQWSAQHVKIMVYDERDMQKKEVVLPKKDVGIVENPFYNIMNEPNSTLQRLIRKLNQLDSADELSSSGKLDLIVQLPYVIKSEARRLEADRRRTEIETQLRGSKYGIAYTDGTERVTQLNRPAENNLHSQVKELTDSLYNQMGLTKEIFEGTANEMVMRNYINRSVKPIVGAVTSEMRRKFLTKTARTQKQTLEYYYDLFELISLENFAEIADKFSRNELATGNELRGFIGMRPSTDPKADKLINSNMPQPEEETTEGDYQNGT